MSGANSKSNSRQNGSATKHNAEIQAATVASHDAPSIANRQQAMKAVKPQYRQATVNFMRNILAQGAPL